VIEIPKLMRTLERDTRGYPVPWIVLRDKRGAPQFTINDTRRVRECIRKRLCAICGKRLETSVWFVGGSRCFLHEHGAFLDPPLHFECGEYALRVCPFLAAPRYSKRIGAGKLRTEDVPDGLRLAQVDYMLPLRPERFGFGCASNYRLIDGAVQQHSLFGVLDWEYVEWWRQGERVEAPDSATMQELVNVVASEFKASDTGITTRK